MWGQDKNLGGSGTLWDKCVMLATQIETETTEVIGRTKSVKRITPSLRDCDLKTCQTHYYNGGVFGHVTFRRFYGTNFPLSGAGGKARYRRERVHLRPSSLLLCIVSRDAGKPYSGVLRNFPRTVYFVTGDISSSSFSDIALRFSSSLFL